MSADNPLKATVDAIAESDNEIGGLYVTRITEVHLFGANDGYFETANPTKLKTRSAIFESSHVGRMVDLIYPYNGSYRIFAFVSSTEVTLKTLDGASPTFTDSSTVRFRFSDLLVESTYNWPSGGKRCEVYLGTEPRPLPYGQTKLTLGDYRIEGLGSFFGGVMGVIDTASSTHFDCGESDTFTSNHIGCELWVMAPEYGTATGNEGSRRITSIIDSHTVGFAGPAFVADQANVIWRVKTYLPDGYMTKNQRQYSEVIDNSLTLTAIGRLKRAFKIDLADGDEIDRIARMGGMGRPAGLSDELWRRVVQAIMFGPKSTLQAFESLLTALYPLKNFSIYEDLTNRPSELFLALPWMTPDDDYTGKAFTKGDEKKTSTSSTSITVDNTPHAVYGVSNQDVDVQTADAFLLPSADTPAWTYVAANNPTEGSVFTAISGNYIQHEQNGTNDGGHYRYTAIIPRPTGWLFMAMVNPSNLATVNGHPWALRVRDGQCHCSLLFNSSEFFLGDYATYGAYSAMMPCSLPIGQWSEVMLERRGDVILGRVNGSTVSILSSACGSTSSKDASFGHFTDGLAQDFTLMWNQVRFFHESKRNYWNVSRITGTLSNPATLTDASNPFIVGDTGKLVVISSVNNKNHGRWKATYSSASTVTLEGFPIPHATVMGKNSDPDGARITLRDGHFTERDVGKSAIVSASTLGNNGTYLILQVVSPSDIRVDYAAGFQSETGLTVAMQADFVAETNVEFELVNASSFVGATLTLRDALDAANQPVDVFYTKIPSAHILFNEFVQNDGVIPELYYPFYLYDVDNATRVLCESIKAAGIKITYAVP